MLLLGRGSPGPFARDSDEPVTRFVVSTGQMPVCRGLGIDLQDFVAPLPETVVTIINERKPMKIHSNFTSLMVSFNKRF